MYAFVNGEPNSQYDVNAQYPLWTQSAGFNLFPGGLDSASANDLFLNPTVQFVTIPEIEYFLWT